MVLTGCPSNLIAIIWSLIGFIYIICTNVSGNDDDIEDFYGRLRDLIDTVPRGVVLTIMGDWNAAIGDKSVEGISGTHGLGYRRIVILLW